MTRPRARTPNETVLPWIRRARRAPAALTVLAAVLAASAGCTSFRASRQAEIAAQQGDWDQAVVHYLEAVEQDPANIQHKSALLRAKIRASQEHFEKAKRYQQANVLDRALIELQQAVQLDPTNQYAEAELASVKEKFEAAQRGGGVETLEELKKKSSGARPQPPVLDPRSDKPISLNFPEPTSVFQIYRALGKAFGINVLFDPNLKDQEISLELEDVTSQAALETLMRAAGHFYKVQDEHTIIIAADTPQNRRTYEDLVIQTFFLSNSEVKDMMTILRSLVDAKKIATNEQLNAIILRDTADKVKVAERIIEANDKSKAELVIDVELLQLDTGRLRELGSALSQYSITQSLDLGGEDVPLRFSDLEFLNQSNWTLTIPNFIYNFLKQNSEAQLLARPQLRISEGEKARLVIGDRVPIPVTTFNTANTVGGNIVPITSFQYQEVGIQIELEPRVHHNQEVTLKVKVEVSQISRFVEGSGGQQQPVIGTRTIDSTIRLKDGETNFLAGLIRTDESQSQSGVPGLSDIPILGHLFSNRRTNQTRTDVILTLTPHIIRQAAITEEDLLPIWVGTESNITFRGGSPRVESDVEGPFDAGGGATPEEIQEMMRRRIERLPRGLREGQQGVIEAPPPEPPPGIDLVPGLSNPDFGTQQKQEQQDEEPVDEEPFDDSGILEGEPVEGVAALGRPAAGSRVLPASWRGSAEVRLASLGDDEPAVEDAAVGLRLVAEAEGHVAVGEPFVVRLEAAARRGLSHLPLVLEFDPARLAVERIEPGDFLGAAGAAQVLADTSQAGRIVLGASRLGARPDVTGGGVVARITFRPLAPGAVEVVFAKVVARDRELAEVGPVAAPPATFQVRARPFDGRPGRPSEAGRPGGEV